MGFKNTPLILAISVIDARFGTTVVLEKRQKIWRNLNLIKGFHLVISLWMNYTSKRKETAKLNFSNTPKIIPSLPKVAITAQSVKGFKKHIKVWNFICNCRLCKSFVVNLGYI